MLRYFAFESFENSRDFCTRIFIQFRKAIDRTFPLPLSLSFSLFCRSRPCIRHVETKLAGFVLEARASDTGKINYCPPLVSSARGSVRFSGTRAWKIQFSGHVLRCQLGARWDVWSCESYSAEILFVRLWFGREHGHFGRQFYAWNKIFIFLFFLSVMDSSEHSF